MLKINNWNLEDKEITESTNDDAVALSAHITDGKNFIISAQKQTKGRGRRGRTWIGLEGNLFFSQGIIFEERYIGQLIVISTYSLYHTIRELSSEKHKVQIKWPNDILIDDNKVSGMLLEKGENNYFVIGIGVNIKTAPKNSEMLYPATSLAEKGIIIDRLAFLRSYINNFDMYMHQWQHTGFVSLKQQWLEVVKGLNTEINVRTEKKEISGLFIGIGEDGELLLSYQGIIKKIYAGDVFYKKEKNK